MLIPGGVALCLAMILCRWQSAHPKLAAGGWFLATAMMLAPLWIWNIERQRHLLPGAVMQPAMRNAGEAAWQQTRSDFDAWREACMWIAENTPDDAIFLTPRGQQTFKWYAQRAEVFAGKDIPQDAPGVWEWKRRANDPAAFRLANYGFARLTDGQIIALAERYDATYLLVERVKASRPTGLVLVYPLADAENSEYAVYRIPHRLPQDSGDAS
jgi:hypothetical protein